MSLSRAQPALIANEQLLAVLLPITSRGMDVDQQANALQSLFRSLSTPFCRIYLGIDYNDEYYSSEVGRKNLERCFPGGMLYHIEVFPATTPPAICAITRTLARRAYDDGCFYFLLLGDDVEIETTPPTHLISEIRRAFESIATTIPGLPFGFGCVAFCDESSIGFPTFPIVTRVHMDIFNHEWCPAEFINQDADPYLFELYRYFRASSFQSNLRLRNNIGGTAGKPRYDRHHIRWQDQLLSDGIATIRRVCQETYNVTLHPCLRLDIIVPSVRVQREYLKRIIELPVPENVSTTVIIILDNPRDDSRELQAEWELEYREKVRIRVNPENLGASYTRSRGLDESAAEWILFLDDDVIPEENLLSVITEEIRCTGDQYAGYVGATYMDPWNPRQMTTYAKGVLLVHLLHFWADHINSGRSLAPWGITAQLVLKRTALRFNEVFPLTGGGEDIDLCLRTCALLKLPLKNLPAAQCRHPWWNNGYVHINRFRGWATGDSFLLDLYPKHCYRSWPNGMEIMVFLTLFHVVWGIWQFGRQHSLMIGGGGAVPVCSTGPPYAMLLHVLVSYASTVIMTFALDVIMEMISIFSERQSYLSEVQGWERLWCGLVGIVLYRIGGADYGHVLVPLQRGSWRHLCLRFDWWCGLYPEEPQQVRSREFGRFLVFILGLWVVFSLIMHTGGVNS